MEIRQRSKQEELDRRKVIRLVMVVTVVMGVTVLMLVML